MDWRRLRIRVADAAPRDDLPTDARRAGPRRGEDDRERERARRLRHRALAFGLSAIFLTGSVGAMLADGGYLDLRRERAERTRLEREVAEQRARVEALRDEVSRLHDDPTTLERIAREKLNYSRPGEITFLVPDGVGDASEPRTATPEEGAPGSEPGGP